MHCYTKHTTQKHTNNLIQDNTTKILYTFRHIFVESINTREKNKCKILNDFQMKYSLIKNRTKQTQKAINSMEIKFELEAFVRPIRNQFHRILTTCG